MDLNQVMYESFITELRKIAASKQQMTVPQARKGRRSMSVSTMLKKDNEGTLFKKKAGLMDVLKMPIPGTKDWIIPTGANSLKTTGRAVARPVGAAMRRVAGTRTTGGVTSIGEGELARLGFGDLGKRASMALQGSTTFLGLPIGIEQKKGSTREGVDADGKAWKTTFKIPYGYIKGTKGNDGEEIDAFVGPDKKAPTAFVIHQRKLKGGGYDEDKVMLGFASEEAARQAYLDNYNKNGPKLLGPVTALSVEDLKARLAEKSEHKKLASSPDGTGSGAGPTSSTMYGADSDEAPNRTKAGDSPSRDGTSPGEMKVDRRESHADFATTTVTNGPTVRL